MLQLPVHWRREKLDVSFLGEGFSSFLTKKDIQLYLVLLIPQP